MRKGVTKQAQIEAGIKAKAAGIEINEFYMPGMGGREYARQSALDTADVMNQVNPDFIRIRSMALAENLEMYEDYETGLLTRPNDVETIGEIRLFLENLHGITSWVDSDHILNILLELKGRLPRTRTACWPSSTGFWTCRRTSRCSSAWAAAWASWASCGT